MKKRWIIPTTDSSEAARANQIQEKCQALSSAEGILPAIAQLVLKRTGGDLDAAQRFLKPQLKFLRPPADLPDMPVAVERVFAAIEKRDIIAVHGDYDVDGTVAVALMVSTLKSWGAQAIAFIPDRGRDGYGVSRRGIDQCVERGAKLLITCDCGISAHDEVEYARSRGLDVIVTDHHLPSRADLPKALAVVNPQRSDSKYAFTGICGTGVAFCFLVALRALLRERGYFTGHAIPEGDLREALDLVAIATLADSVPLVDDNRILVSKGLQVLEKTRRPGLQALMETTGLRGKKLGSWDVIFKIVPRLNVAGRMERADLALEMLLTTDASRATQLAHELEALNTERRRIEGEVRDQAMAQIEAQSLLSGKALVLAGETWHRGVIGIVASKLSERFGRPAAVIALGENEGTGSVRGVAGVNLVDAMNHCKSHLLRHGGHAMAAGLTVARSQLDDFRRAFLDYMDRALEEENLSPLIQVACDLPLSDLSPEWLNQMALLEPFGESNPEPVFVAYGVAVREARVVGETHLKLVVDQRGTRHDVIGFGLSSAMPECGKTIDIAFTPRWNEFRGARKIQLDLKDLR